MCKMKGKALFLKTIAVQQKMLRSGFRRMSDDLTLAQAADIPTRVTFARHDAANHIRPSTHSHRLKQLPCGGERSNDAISGIGCNL